MSTTTALNGIVGEHVAAINAHDEDAIVATFAADALVNDAHREFWGADAIRRWVTKEIVGDRVTVEPIELIEHDGQTIVRGRYDGEYDKTGLPDPLILTSYFTVRDGRIVSLIVIHNTPPTDRHRQDAIMSTHVVNEFRAKPGRGDDVLALLLELSPESRGRPGCEAIAIRRNQDDQDNLIGDTPWATRQHYDDYLAWRTQNGYTASFDQMLSEPMLIRYFDEIPFGPEPGTRDRD